MNGGFPDCLDPVSVPYICTAGTTTGDKMLDASNVCTPPPSNGTAAEMRKKPNKE